MGTFTHANRVFIRSSMRPCVFRGHDASMTYFTVLSQLTHCHRRNFMCCGIDVNTKHPKLEKSKTKQSNLCSDAFISNFLLAMIERRRTPHASNSNIWLRCAGLRNTIQLPSTGCDAKTRVALIQQRSRIFSCVN